MTLELGGKSPNIIMSDADSEFPGRGGLALNLKAATSRPCCGPSLPRPSPPTGAVSGPGLREEGQAPQHGPAASTSRLAAMRSRRSSSSSQAEALGCPATPRALSPPFPCHSLFPVLLSSQICLPCGSLPWPPQASRGGPPAALGSIATVAFGCYASCLSAARSPHAQKGTEWQTDTTRSGHNPQGSGAWQAARRWRRDRVRGAGSQVVLLP